MLQIGFVFFGAPDLPQALGALRGMLTWQRGAAGMTFAAFAEPKVLCLLGTGALLCGPLQALFPRWKEALRSREVPGIPALLGLGALFLLSVAALTGSNYHAFIYAQF